ncbi:hypothetical protein LEP1GSC059_2597 [Leptospira noguchii serovar Panama str. CZ214]|uniref:Uncharacterized protein n=1 Tax=Leptospira noguchii serovar Panama str. CZ214 TaxID=1001595 RepID=T0FPD0_9LEPT|nr:hypothetical protein LEP1GSC059_2597 [Leptospira noguchii serovar Panama str. CZ214]
MKVSFDWEQFEKIEFRIETKVQKFGSEIRRSVLSSSAFFILFVVMMNHLRLQNR